MAPSAIWRPKLEETLCTLDSASKARLRACVRRGLLLRRQLLGLDLEAAVLLDADLLAAADDLRSALAERRGLRANVLERDGLGCRERDLRPALEVDAEIEALDRDRAERDQEHDARDREPAVPKADEVAPDPGGRLALGPHQSRVVEPLEAAEQAEDRARRRDRGQQRHQRSDQEHEREALDSCRRDEEEHHRGDRSDDVGVDDRREALAVAGRDRGSHRFAGAILLLHALEDDDVRVGGHPQRQDHPGEARQGQRHVEDQDRRVEEGRVDAEPEHGDDAEHAVEDEQEDGDDDEAGDRRAPRLAQRVLTERRRDRRRLERRERDGQGAGLEHERQVLRLLRGRRCP